MLPMSHVSDSDHCKLEAEARPDCIVESHQVSDPSRGLRRAIVTKTWRYQRLLGEGGFGRVYLQVLESDKETVRALKVVSTRGRRMSIADCEREIAAMAEFRKPKVCSILQIETHMLTFISVPERCSLC
jgi:hypothetical protein